MPINQTLTVAPTEAPLRFRAEDGSILSPPPGWELLPPGDAGLTRRVKDAGPSWTVIELKGRKKFSRGVWAPAAHIQAAKAALEAERTTEAYAKRRASDTARRVRKQAAYEGEFEQAVLAFLAFAPGFDLLARRLARAVADHATPVGSGTVARTERIPVARRAEAAVIAWMRHQTTGYDQMSIARVKGARRGTRQQLARESRRLLESHRRDEPHGLAGCPLCRAVARLPAEAPVARLEPVDVS